MRTVKPIRGVAAAMGYEYRSRIESRQRATWFGFGKEITEHRYVIERKFMAWGDVAWGRWLPSKQEAVDSAHAVLDRIEQSPKGDYV